MATNERAELRLRVTPELKHQIEDYADKLGIPTNTAAILLLTEALRQHKKAGNTS
jgi:antitoxin component of RelBE/YafQ-DinJ toxin-antitoxin module